MVAKTKPAPKPSAPADERQEGQAGQNTTAPETGEQSGEKVAKADTGARTKSQEPAADRAPWADRLASMSEAELQALLSGNTLGERKRAAVSARLAELRAA